MVRKQIYIPKRQQLLLKRKAKAVGISEAELIRQAIDRNLLYLWVRKYTLPFPKKGKVNTSPCNLHDGQDRFLVLPHIT
jgi:hypothetical protein